MRKPHLLKSFEIYGRHSVEIGTGDQFACRASRSTTRSADRHIGEHMRTKNSCKDFAAIAELFVAGIRELRP